MPRWVFPGTRRHLPERWKEGKRHPYPWQIGCICCSIFRQPFRLQISLRYVNRLICPISRWHIHFLWNCRNCLLYRMNRWHPTELCDSDEEISSFPLWCWERAGQIRRRWLSRICFGDARKKILFPGFYWRERTKYQNLGIAVIKRRKRMIYHIVFLSWVFLR